MSFRFGVITAAMMCVSSFVVIAGQVDGIRIAKYKNDRLAAISFTFDDNMRDQDEFAVPMLEKYGFHATFFVVAKATPDTNEEAAKKKAGEHGSISWRRLKELSVAGHEIGNHSWTHANLRKADDAKLEEEVMLAYKRITEKIGFPPLTFCYPGNGYDERVRSYILRDHIAGRDKLVGYGGKDFTTEQANARVDDAIKKGQPLVGMIHGITTGYQPFSSADVLENHLRYVKSRESEIWVDTFANVMQYINERDAVKLTQTLADGRATFTVDCPLDPGKYFYPITVIIPARGAANVEARGGNGNKSFPVAIQNDRILVQIVPSSQPVVVTWK